MKLYIKLCLFFLIIPIISWCQEQEKTIEVTFLKAYKNFRDTTSVAPKTIENIEYKLVCNTNEARFEIVPKKEKNMELTSERFLYNYEDQSVYYKNIPENLKLSQTISPFDKKLYLVKSSFNEYDWVITKEKKEILGYTCYKAYTEYEYKYKVFKYIGKDTKVKVKIIAWFTPEINYSFGPAGVDGLPGLVLEKYSASFYLIASKIAFNNSIDINILKPKEGIEITYGEYHKTQTDLQKKYFEN